MAIGSYRRNLNIIIRRVSNCFMGKNKSIEEKYDIQAGIKNFCLELLLKIFQEEYESSEFDMTVIFNYILEILIQDQSCLIEIWKNMCAVNKFYLNQFNADTRYINLMYIRVKKRLVSADEERKKIDSIGFTENYGITPYSGFAAVKHFVCNKCLNIMGKKNLDRHRYKCSQLEIYNNHFRKPCASCNLSFHIKLDERISKAHEDAYNSLLPVKYARCGSYARSENDLILEEIRNNYNRARYSNQKGHCSFAEIGCVWCRKRMRVIEYEAYHFDACGAELSEKPCKLCNERFPRIDFHEHETEKCKNITVKCKRCDSDSYPNDPAREEHHIERCREVRTEKAVEIVNKNMETIFPAYMNEYFKNVFPNVRDMTTHTLIRSFTNPDGNIQSSYTIKNVDIEYVEASSYFLYKVAERKPQLGRIDCNIGPYKFYLTRHICFVNNVPSVVYFYHEEEKIFPKAGLNILPIRVQEGQEACFVDNLTL